jgi:predicted TIM-barrel fold metal-dependent hydrolase
MKIDCHVHITPPEISGNAARYAQKEPYFALLTGNKSNKFATAPDVISALSAAHFDKAVVFGFAFKDMGLCRVANDYVIDAVKSYPDNLIGFCVVPPASGECEKEIERCVSAGLRGVGELFPSGQNFDLGNERETGSFTRAALAYTVPVLIHANEPVGHDYAGKTNTTLSQIECFVKHNPALKIILAHWGGGILFYELMKEVKDSFKNVYYDSAASPFLYDERIYSRAFSLLDHKKIVFGSDYPLINISRYLKDIEKSPLGAVERDLFLGDNAKELLGLCDFKDTARGHGVLENSRTLFKV